LERIAFCPFETKKGRILPALFIGIELINQSGIKVDPLAKARREGFPAGLEMHSFAFSLVDDRGSLLAACLSYFSSAKTMMPLTKTLPTSTGISWAG
jgi:hypothetical protein